MEQNILPRHMTYIKRFRELRRTLIDAGVPTLDVAKYESDYVTAIKKGKFESFVKIYEDRKSVV